jgi:hypothetical protein
MEAARAKQLGLDSTSLTPGLGLLHAHHSTLELPPDLVAFESAASQRPPTELFFSFQVICQMTFAPQGALQNAPRAIITMPCLPSGCNNRGAGSRAEGLLPNRRQRRPTAPAHGANGVRCAAPGSGLAGLAQTVVFPLRLSRARQEAVCATCWTRASAVCSSRPQCDWSQAATLPLHSLQSEDFQLMGCKDFGNGWVRDIIRIGRKMVLLHRGFFSWGKALDRIPMVMLVQQPRPSCAPANRESRGDPLRRPTVSCFSYSSVEERRCVPR